MVESTAVIEEEEECARNASTASRAASLSVPSTTLPSNYSRLQRQAKTHALMGSSCGIWLSYIVVGEHVAQAIAWVFVLGGLLLSSLSRWLSVRQELFFCLEPRFQPDVASEVRATAHKQTDDRELEELVAPIIAVFSIALPLVLLVSFLIFHIDLARLSKPVVKRQVVEIELVALSDAIDKKDILPAINKEATSRANKGALYTVASPTLIGAAIPRSTPSAKADTSDKGRVEDKLVKADKSISHSQITTTRERAAESVAKVESRATAEEKASTTTLPLTFKAPENWKTIVVAKEKDKSIAFSTYAATNQVKSQATNQATARAKAQSAPLEVREFLSEVEPANMIESIDSDGQVTHMTTQIGGRSNFGTGAPSTLHSYLKLLNRKVKSHWIPPRGIDRIAVIEFRISADGKLVSTKALPHSGNTNAENDAEAEAAAISAIKKSFPFHPLPAEVKASSLDVRFTFNYRFNQIDEVGSNN
jgi:hypothetical protein